jgi:hypothetical protein
VTAEFDNGALRHPVPHPQWAEQPLKLVGENGRVNRADADAPHADAHADAHADVCGRLRMLAEGSWDAPIRGRWPGAPLRLGPETDPTPGCCVTNWFYVEASGVGHERVTC